MFSVHVTYKYIWCEFVQCLIVIQGTAFLCIWKLNQPLNMKECIFQVKENGREMVGYSNKWNVFCFFSCHFFFYIYIYSPIFLTLALWHWPLIFLYTSVYQLAYIHHITPHSGWLYEHKQQNICFTSLQNQIIQINSNNSDNSNSNNSNKMTSEAWARFKESYMSEMHCFHFKIWSDELQISICQL